MSTVPFNTTGVHYIVVDPRKPGVSLYTSPSRRAAEAFAAPHGHHVYSVTTENVHLWWNHRDEINQELTEGREYVGFLSGNGGSWKWTPRDPKLLLMDGWTTEAEAKAAIMGAIQARWT